MYNCMVCDNGLLFILSEKIHKKSEMIPNKAHNWKIINTIHFSICYCSKWKGSCKHGKEGKIVLQKGRVRRKWVPVTKQKTKRTINQKYKEHDSESDKSRRKVTQRNRVLGHLFAQGPHLVWVLCMCVCFSRRPYTCTDWVGWLSGLAWSSVDPPPGQFSVRPCQGQLPASGWVGVAVAGGREGEASSACSPGFQNTVSNSNRNACTHKHP